MHTKSLRNKLKNWTDSDVAAYEIGKALGFFSPDEHYSSTKWIFRSSNPLGEALSSILNELVKVGAVETTEEIDQVRWNPKYGEEENDQAD